MATIFEDARTDDVLFSNLNEGDFFEFEGEIWIKTEEVVLADGASVNAVGTDNGVLELFLEDTSVTPIKKIRILE